MNDILNNILYLKCFEYIDDVIVLRKTKSECIQYTKEVVKLIYGDNLNLGCFKCEFVMDKVEILGHIVAYSNLHPKTDKI